MLRLLLVSTCLLGPALADNPPSFTARPVELHKEYIPGHGPNNVIEFKCVVNASPRAEYYWEKNGELYEPEGNRVQMEHGLGTLTFSWTEFGDDGYYQCFARNSLGTAMSDLIYFDRSLSGQFELTGTTTKTVRAGSTVKLPCTGKPDYSKSPYWQTKELDQKKGGTALEYTNRVNQDYDGNLWFVNVQVEDQLEDQVIYECAVYNHITSTTAGGAGVHLIVSAATSGRGDSSSNRLRRPMLLYAPPRQVVGLLGESAKMKCIFSGNPAPNVTWERVGGSIDASRHDVTRPLELVLNDISVTDAGTYRCVAHGVNGETSQNEFDVVVEAKPKWEQKPNDKSVAVGEDAEFKCEASGLPRPNIQWFVNGVEIELAETNPRRRVSGDTVTFTDLKKEDSQVLQCNATNQHGHIFTNAYLNVQAVPPMFMEKDQSPIFAAEGSTRPVKCRYYGVPTPTITWQKDDVMLTGSRFKVLSTGDLEIKNIEMSDAGELTCVARNKFGEDDTSITLIVRERTHITDPPEDAVVEKGEDAIFTCGAETDDTLEELLEIEWKKDGEIIDVDADDKYSVEDDGRTLVISSATADDTAVYTCEASNGLDVATADATLTVQSEPSPPRTVGLRDCNAFEAVISWQEGDDNNSPILGYVVEYNTSLTDWTSLDVDIPATDRTASISLYPYNKYYFRVSARNAIGTGEPTEARRSCETPATRPINSPKNVRIVDEGPRKLVVMWDPIPRIQHCGPNFQYKIFYRRLDIHESLKVELVSQSHIDKRTFDGVPIYKPYEIEVVSANAEGQSRNSAGKVVGFSGEDVPSQVVQNFRLDSSQPVTDSDATFLLDAVDESSDATNGFFVGYQIEFWKEGDPDNKEHWNHTVRNVADEGKEWRSRVGRRRRQYSSGHSEVMITVKNLPAFSEVKAHVMVMNKKYIGRPSTLAHVTTDEGVPGPVGGIEVDEIGPKHVSLSWDYPDEPNGNIVGYEVEYAKVNDDGQEGPRRSLDSDSWDPTQRQAKVSGLDVDDEYVIYVYAKTKKGRGEPTRIVVRTTGGGRPGSPTVAINGFTNSAMNVTWVPSKDEQFKPASAFYVEYKVKGEDPWTRTKPVSHRQWQNLTDLASGSTYLVRVVASNGPQDYATSETEEVALGEPQAGAMVDEAPVAIWFIVLMVLLALFVILLFIVCLIRYNQGQKYRIDDPPEHNFEEYKRPAEPYTKRPSQASLESDTKPGFESETDSMAAYDDDPTKFNEDGSFIGQYGAKKKAPPEDATTPTAVSTFV